MNFLSHYYIVTMSAWNNEEGKDANFLLGNVLPDFIGIFNRRAGASIKQENKSVVRLLPADFKNNREESTTPGHESFNSIDQGIRVHFMVDSLFHSSLFFKENVHFIRDSLSTKNFSFSLKYGSFIGHIFLELMLDRLLLKENEHNGTEFYKNLKNVDKKLLKTYLNERNYVLYGREFLDFFKRFISVQYIFEYIQNEGFIFALNRIIQSAGMQSFEGADQAELTSSIIEVEKNLSSEYKQIFNEINQAIDVHA